MTIIDPSNGNTMKRIEVKLPKKYNAAAAMKARKLQKEKVADIQSKSHEGMESHIPEVVNLGNECQVKRDFNDQILQEADKVEDPLNLNGQQVTGLTDSHCIGEADTLAQNHKKKCTKRPPTCESDTSSNRVDGRV